MSSTQPSHAHHGGVLPTPVGKNNICAELHELFAHQMRRGSPPLWQQTSSSPGHRAATQPSGLSLLGPWGRGLQGRAQHWAWSQNEGDDPAGQVIPTGVGNLQGVLQCWPGHSLDILRESVNHES